MSKKAEKKTKPAKKPEEMKNLPWNEEMVIALLKVVYDTKAHLQSHNKNVGIYWHNVATKFFDQPDCILFKDKHLIIDPDTKQADYRKIRDKYNKVMEAVQLDIEKGNQSGKEGDLSPLYKLVKLINDEIDAQDEEKATAKEIAENDKHQLAKNESTVLGTVGKKRNVNTAIRVRAADGTITVDAEREKKQQNKSAGGLDEMVLRILQEKYNPSPDSSAPPVVVQSRSERVLSLMSSFVENNYYCTESFLSLAYRVTNAPPPADLQLELQLIGGLEMLLSLYCSSEDNFSATLFCQHMQQLEINAKPARIIHLQLEKWRKLVETPIPSSLSVTSTRSSADISALTSIDRSNDSPPFDGTRVTHNLSSENAIGSVADPSNTLKVLQEIDTALCSTILDFELPMTSSINFGP